MANLTLRTIDLMALDMVP